MSNRVLVIDDEPDFSGFVERACQALDCRIRACQNGEQARDILASFRPDLIVLDMIMPREDGFEFLKWYTDQPERAPVLLVTGYDVYYAEMASKLSALSGIHIVGILQKPVPLRKLREAISGGLQTGLAGNDGGAATEAC